MPISVPVWLACPKSIVLDNKYCASMAALRKLFQFGGVIPDPNALCLFFLIGLAPIRDPQISRVLPSLLSIPVSAATAENTAGGCLSNTYQVTSRAVFGPLLRNGSLREGAGAWVKVLRVRYKIR